MAHSTALAATAASGTGNVMKVNRTYIRMARDADVAHVVRLVRQLAEFEKLLDECEATEENLRAALFGPNAQGPFRDPTVLMAEVSEEEETSKEEEGSGAVAAAAAAAAATAEAGAKLGSVAPGFQVAEETTEVKAKEGERGGRVIVDDEKHTFESTYKSKRTVVGFVLLFPNFSTFLMRQGLYIEDLYIRLPYRGLGFGTRFLSFAARLCSQIGAGRLEWSVLDWNQRAIDFYTKRMGATLMEEWRICRLTGDALVAAGDIDKESH